MRAEGEGETIMEDVAAGGEGHADEAMEEDEPAEEVQRKRSEMTPARQPSETVMGPKKTRVLVRDSAWSTWWAVLYWVSTFLLSESLAHGTAIHRYYLFRSPFFIFRPHADPTNPFPSRHHVFFPAPRSERPP